MDNYKMLFLYIIRNLKENPDSTETAEIIDALCEVAGVDSMFLRMYISGRLSNEIETSWGTFHIDNDEDMYDFMNIIESDGDVAYYIAEKIKDRFHEEDPYMYICRNIDEARVKFHDIKNMQTMLNYLSFLIKKQGK